MLHFKIFMEETSSSSTFQFLYDWIFARYAVQRLFNGMVNDTLVVTKQDDREHARKELMQNGKVFFYVSNV